MLFEDYTIEYIIKVNPTEYVFTTGDNWETTEPWADPSVTINRSFPIGTVLDPAYLTG